LNPFEGYRVTSPYGWRTSPITVKREFHTGIDLVKYHQAPIYAFTSGEVIHAKEGAPGSGFGGYGIVVAVKCPQTGHLHCYAHLDSASVAVGQFVEAGQMIGQQGSTGQSTGSHLHYEIRKSSSPQFGWMADRENNCFEPTQYLIDYYRKNDSTTPNESNQNTIQNETNNHETNNNETNKHETINETINQNVTNTHGGDRSKLNDPGPSLSREDAEKIIRFLSSGWFATGDPEARAEFHRLANEIRKAAGIPVQ
jgi:murein DD-endopeptidase MepM/ murein hydrolase activator NlpD